MIPHINKIVEEKYPSKGSGGYYNKYLPLIREAFINGIEECKNNPSIYLPDYILRSEALVWVKASERLPENPQSKQQLFIKHYNRYKVIVFLIDYETKKGNWCWSLAYDDSKGHRISKDEFDKIEWLSTPSSNELRIADVEKVRIIIKAIIEDVIQDFSITWDSEEQKDNGISQYAQNIINVITSNLTSTQKEEGGALMESNKRMKDVLQKIGNVLIDKQFEILDSPLRKTVVNISDISNVLDEYGIIINRKTDF